MGPIPVSHIRCGLKINVYRCFQSLISLFVNVFLSISIILFTFEIAEGIWSFSLRLDETCIPMSFPVLLSSTLIISWSLPCKKYLKPKFFFQKCATLHIFTLSLTSQSFIHFDTISKSFYQTLFQLEIELPRTNLCFLPFKKSSNHRAISSSSPYF